MCNHHVDQIIEAYEKGIAKGSEVSCDVKNAEYQRGRVARRQLRQFGKSPENGELSE